MTDRQSNGSDHRKPRMAASLLVIVLIASLFGGVVAFVLLKVQYDILLLANEANHRLLPEIQVDVLAVTNLERLKALGEIVRNSHEAGERREALLAARLLTMETVYEQNPYLKDQVNRAFLIIDRIARQRIQQDDIRRQIDTELDAIEPLFATLAFDQSSPAPARRYLDLLQWLRMAMVYPGARATDPSLPRQKRKHEPPTAIAGLSPLDPAARILEKIQRVLQLQDSLLETRTDLAKDWADAHKLLDNLSRNLSVSATVAASNGSAEIARYAEQAMLVVALALGGLLLLFAATLYSLQQLVVNPILRATGGLEQVRATRGSVRLRRERLRELDDIAAAVEAFGEALAQISEHTAELEREIVERQQAQAKLVELATTDSLTGLRNRRYFMETATQEFERARRYRTPLSLLMLDADRFKLINDRFGHPVGDEALRVLAATGQRQMREADLFARLGGEEFAVLLPQTDPDAARVVAERLRQLIAEQPVVAGGESVHFTVSIGLAHLESSTTSLDDLLRQADAALYQAKQNGRNRVEPALD